MALRSDQAQLRDMNLRTLSNIGNFTIHGQTTVTTAGEAVIIMVSQPTMVVTIKAKTANSGNIFVGDADVSSSNGFILDAGEETTLGIDHALDNIYIDTDNDGDGVSYIAWTSR